MLIVLWIIDNDQGRSLGPVAPVLKTRFCGHSSNQKPGPRKYSGGHSQAAGSNLPAPG
jgi:hypothetical protein